MIINPIFEDMINSPVRTFRGRVELYEGSAPTLVCGCHDRLKNFTVERVGETDKFFGFGVCQKINTHLLDPKRELNITTANSIEVVFGKDSEYIYPYPRFYVSEVHRDEKTNELSITAYDALYKTTKYTVSDLGFTSSYTIREFAEACGTLLGLPVSIPQDSAFDIFYESGANFDGTETIRTALDAIAEATQTIYYINWDWQLTFKRLDLNGEEVLTIDREKYFDLDNKTNRRLSAICHATELGDNVSADTGVSGTTQYVRDNPFWDLRDDVGTLVDNALAAVGGLTINQFDCSWRGNFLLEIGDKISLITKDNEKVYSYVFDDVISFDGVLSEKTQWSYNSTDTENASNPSSLGDVLKQTYARVDKANRQIDLVASEVGENSEAIGQLQVKTDNIRARVEEVNKDATDAIGSLGGEIDEVRRSVDLKMSAEDVQIAISTQLSNGVSSVETTTGFTFNQDGLTVSKSDSEMTTQITEDGMTVYRDDTAVLVADNEGVKAEDLHATTYLIIGKNSRFEDYGNRTGCFWIGG